MVAVSHRPADWVQKSLAAHQEFFQIFETTFIDKTIAYEIIDLLKRNKFYMEYFFVKVVVIKAQRVEKRD